MTSSLRFSMSATYPQSSPVIQKTISSPPQKKQKMSLAQTYYLAHTARGKLSKEASRADHDLRLLVGHANLLDGLMLDLADAEREQENWFNTTVKGAAKASKEPKHIQWADTIAEEAVEEEAWDAESSDSEEDSDDEDEVQYARSIALHRQSKPSTTVTAMEIDEDMEEDEDYEDDLALTRTSTHPPELLHESDSESDDESMPPSPPQTEMSLDSLSEKQRQAIATTSFYQSIPETSGSDAASLPPSEQASFFDEGFYLPQRQTTIVSAY